MFGSNVLEIATGLIFVYLSLSLVCTAATELLASVTRSRAKDLERGLRNLLDGNSQLPERWWHKLARHFSGAAAPVPGPWSEQFFQHQLINSLSKNNEKPSYVPSQLFATVVMRLITRAGTPAANAASSGFASFNQISSAISEIANPGLREALLPLVEQARTDMTDGVAAVTKFNDQVEIWFDFAMDRVSGWYKRRTQWILFAIAILGAFLLNVDTIAISRALATDDTLRASVVAASQKAADGTLRVTSTTAPAAGSEFGLVVNNLHGSITDLKGLGIPVGWRWEPSVTGEDQTKTSEAGNYRYDDLYAVLHSPTLIWSKLCGLLLTAFAASLGAPFWFDLLNKFMSVRSAGRAPEEKPKHPKVVLQPQAPIQAG